VTPPAPPGEHSWPAGPAPGQARGERQAGQVGAAAAAGLVPDPVQAGADGADADVQLGGDLGIGPAPGDQGDQLPFPFAEPGQSRRCGGRAGGGEHQKQAFPAAGPLGELESFPQVRRGVLEVPTSRLFRAR